MKSEEAQWGRPKLVPQRKTARAKLAGERGGKRRVGYGFWGVCSSYHLLTRYRQGARPVHAAQPFLFCFVTLVHIWRQSLGQASLF